MGEWRYLKEAQVETYILATQYIVIELTRKTLKTGQWDVRLESTETPERATVFEVFLDGNICLHDAKIRALEICKRFLENALNDINLQLTTRM